MGPQRSGIKPHVAWLQSTASEGLAHELLAWLLRTQHRLGAHEGLEQLVHPISLRGDRLMQLGRDGAHRTLPSRIWSVFKSE